MVKYKILKGTQNKRQEVLKPRGLNTGTPNAVVTAVTGMGQSGSSGRMPMGEGAVLRSQWRNGEGEQGFPCFPRTEPVFPEKEGNE